MFNHQPLIVRITRWLLQRLLPKKRYRLIKTSLLQLLGRSDVKRWTEKKNLYVNWEERTQIMAQWIPDGTSVMEFGCGNMVIKQYLPDNCQYTASDIVKRDENTIVLDLNQKSLPKLARHDIFLFSGVIEYVYDIERLIQVSSQVCNLFIASYVPCDIKNVSTIAERRSEGWVNNYSKSEFIELMRDNGFRLLEEKAWQNQLLFLFSGS